MELLNECLKCIELRKSLQVEKKKVSQKNRLITLLKELVRSYEAKDLNLTYTDLSQIYESSASEVTILKQRLTLYLNENQELLQLKNEISSRNDFLEKKYRDIEDELSHLRFVNKQLGDYYREKEADHDQHKERLKKLARKLLSYEPKNSEVRKILNLQNSPIDLDPKPVKNSNRKKTEEKDMKKDNIEDDDSTTTKSKSLDSMNLEELDTSGSSECEDNTDVIENSNFCLEEVSNSLNSELVNDTSEVSKISDGFLTSKSFDDKSNSEKSCEIISDCGDGIIACDESDSSSNCAENTEHCSFYKNNSEKTSNIEIDEDKSKSPEVHPSLFEEDSCSYEDMSDQNEVDANLKDSNDFLAFEDSLPNLISPLKSDEPRTRGFLDCKQTLKHNNVIHDNSDHVDVNQEEKEVSVDINNENVSTDIKNECSSNSGDQMDKKKKSLFQSKYQPIINGGILFTEKPINGSHVPLNGSYSTNYQYQSSHCLGCCNNGFDARPPVTLKLYNCSNVEISIPPVMPNQELPVITVRDKCDLNKSGINTSNNVKLAEPAMYSSSIHDRRNSQCYDNSNNQRISTVLMNSKPWQSRSNNNCTENIQESSNPYFQDGCDKSQNPVNYFLDYLSKNEVSKNKFKDQVKETESDTIECSRLFPIKADKNFDLEHFCYRFGSLSVKCSSPDPCFFKVSTSNITNSTNQFYSSLINISKPPIFHNSLKKSLSPINKNEWIFGQNILSGTKKQESCNKTIAAMNTSNLNKTVENSMNKITRHNIVQKSILELKTDYIFSKNNDNMNNKVTADETLQNPFHKIHEKIGLKGTKQCFIKPVSFDLNSKKTVLKRETVFENPQVMFSQSCIKPPVQNNQSPNEDLNQKLFINNSAKLQTSHWNRPDPLSVITETSESETVLASNDKGSSKSIFDLDQRKKASSVNSTSNSSICNKLKSVPTSRTSPEEAKLHEVQKPLTLINFHRSTKEGVAEIKSKSPKKNRLKETLLIERPVLSKAQSAIKNQNSEFPQTKNPSATNNNSFKKPNAVNIKTASDVKATDNNAECNAFVKKEVKAVTNEKTTVLVPQKMEPCSKLNKTKSSPEAKRHCGQNILALRNGLHKEPKLLNGMILKQGKKRVGIAPIKSVSISCSPCTDNKEDNQLDNELQEIFREMEYLKVPLLSPLRRTPEIPADKKPVENEIKKIEDDSEGNLEKKVDIVKSRKDFEMNSSSDVEDVKVNSTINKTFEKKKERSKYEIYFVKAIDDEILPKENSDIEEKNTNGMKTKKELVTNSSIEDEKINSTMKYETISRSIDNDTILEENSDLARNNNIMKSKKELVVNSSIKDEKINSTMNYETINNRESIDNEVVSEENSDMEENSNIMESKKELTTNSSIEDDKIKSMINCETIDRDSIVDEVISEENSDTEENSNIVKSKKELVTNSSIKDKKVNLTMKYENISSSIDNEIISKENSEVEKNSNTMKSKIDLVTKPSIKDEKINSAIEMKKEPSKCGIIDSESKDNEIILKSKQLFSSIDESEYNIFSDKDDESIDHEDDNVLHIVNPENNEVIEDEEMESFTKPTLDPVTDELAENGEIESFTKTEEIKIYSRKRKKPTDDNISGAEKCAPYTSSTECTTKVSERIIIKTEKHDSPIKEVKPFDSDDTFELSSSTSDNDRPSIVLGFYVNRYDEESVSETSIPSITNTSKLECSNISNNPDPDVSNAATENISSVTDFCDDDNNYELHEEGMIEEKVIPLKREESSGKKRKLHERKEHVEGMCRKKQKMFSDDEYISCESDVFICALRYLSAVAVASFDGNVCIDSKSNSDANLTSKIAINHIKNLIIESRRFVDDVYNALNSTVKKMRQIKDASATILAKAIIELIVESNDKTEAKDKPYMPSMTKTVKACLLVAVSFIGYRTNCVMEFCEVFEQYISSFYDKSLTVTEGSQLVIFYTSFCRSYNLDEKVKYLIYDVLYTRNIKAYPMVYKVIQTWPDILPHSDTCLSRDCLLTQTIIFILLTGASAVDEKSLNIYCINNIRTYLFKYFGYKCNFMRREEITDKIIENIAAKGGSLALVLLCKCEPWEWSLNIVEKKLLPILQSSKEMDEIKVCEYILTVGRVVRGFPIAKAAHVVKNTLEVFERMLQESHSTHLYEIIIEAISLLRRHNLMKCTAILMSWKPNTKQITEKTIHHISSILRVKNVAYWKNVYSAHSSNIIHNTRTFWKKRKLGFQNTI